MTEEIWERVRWLGILMALGGFFTVGVVGIPFMLIGWVICVVCLFRDLERKG